MKTFLLKNCHHPPECRLAWREGKPIVIEKEKITVAAVPLNGSSPLGKNGKLRGDRLKDCIIVHPRYVDGMKHELLKVEGLRNGRTIDILLGEPFCFGAEEHWVMNFKGVGANAVEPMVIHPTKWFEWNESKHIGKWMGREFCDLFGRAWGAVRTAEARTEINGDVMQPLGIPMVAHVQANRMPVGIMNEICRCHGESGDRLLLSQVVRACRTNMRMGMADALGPSKAAQIDVEKFGKIDAAVIDTQLWYAQKGSRLYSSGDILSNRYVDGTFTDSENYAVRGFDDWKCRMLVSAILRSTISILPKKLVEPYVKMLAGTTGIPFDKEHNGKYDYNQGREIWTPDPGVPIVIKKSKPFADGVGRNLDLHFADALAQCTKYG